MTSAWINKVCLVIASCCLLNISWGQDLLFNLRYFTVEDGLADPTALSIIQSDDGKIWIGTNNGLNIYDGHQFSRFEDPSGVLSTRKILSLRKTANGQIWVNPIGSSPILVTPQPQAILPAKFGLDKIPLGVSPFFPASDQAESYFFTNLQKEILFISPNKRLKKIPSLAFKSEAQLRPTPWGTILITEPNQQQIFEYDAHGKVVHQFPWALPNCYNLSLAEDHYFRFFIPDSAAATNATLNQLIFHLEKGGQPQPISLYKDGRPLRVSDLNWQSHIPLSLAKDKTGNYWLSSKRMLWFFDAEGHFVKDLSSLFDEKTRRNWTPHSIFVDTHNRIWLGTGVGVFLLEAKINPFQIYTTPERDMSSRSLYEFPNGNILINTYRGCKLLSSNLELIRKIPLQYFGNGLSKGPGDTLYIGSHSNKLQILRTSDFSTSYSVVGSRTEALTPFYDTLSQLLYVGTKQGLFWSADRGSTFHRFISYNNYTEFSNSRIKFFKRTGEGLWICTTTGLYLYQENRGIIDQFRHQQYSINHFYLDQDGIFWIATQGGGLLKWNRATGALKAFTTENGLSHNVIYAVYEDDQGQLWLPSNRGLMRFNKQTENVIIFRTNDGLANPEFNTFSHLKTKDGRLFFGGIYGLTAFHPTNINLSEQTDPLIVTKLEQYDGQTNQITNRTNQLKTQQKITLRPGDKFFSLSFSYLDYLAEKKSYAWKVDGIDEDWNYQEVNNIRIQGLPFGNHLLQIKAKSSGGSWSKDTLQIPIVVLCPFYLEPYFLIGVGSLLLLLTFGFVHWRLYRTEREKFKLTSLVLARTREISEKNIALAEANQAKDRLYGIIAHDLRAPVISLRGITKKINFLLENKRFSEIEALGPTVEKAVSRTQKLLDNLLNWALIQRNGFPHRPEKVCMNALLNDVVDLYINAAKSKGISLHLELNTGVIIDCDKDALATIARNLLDNAIKFTPKGGQVNISAEVKNEQVIIHIQDNGVGIAPEKMEDLFTLNNDKRTVGTEGEKSTGLGLVLCKELVTMNNGDITVSSKLGQGTTFKINFPVHYWEPIGTNLSAK